MNKQQKHKVFIIGSGGREHALGWKLKQSPKVKKIYFAPGNAGTSQIGENVDISALDIEGLAKFAEKNKIDLTVVGPDDALAKGVVDVFQEKGLMIFGPVKKAAQIEWSKAFSKDLMREAGVPTAIYQTFTDFQKAKYYLHKQKMPIVIKASGLALGKGVIIARTLVEAENALEAIMIKKIFGDAGDQVVIEEFLTGHEVSIHAFSDGKTVSMFPASRDHKPIYEGNLGPNTGGMGTIVPLPYITNDKLDEIKNRIVLPIVSKMKQTNPYTGILYPGIMVTDTGEKVLEFNSRFGDPETQAYMRILKTDLFDILIACCTGTLSEINIKWEEKYACCIILASAGYPGNYKKGVIIEGLENASQKEDIIIFHAGTKNVDGKIATNGGRVLGVTATGKTLEDALNKAYAVIGKDGIHFAGMRYRHDIGRVRN
jgi:phosphoribosylamine--glycine ligase